MGKKNEGPQGRQQDLNSFAPISDENIIGIVDEILQEGINRRASDIHLEPVEDGLAVRLRIDGMLYPLRHFPKELMILILSRLKIMAGMDIAEKRLPQDSNIYLDEKNQVVNIRVSTLPIIYGEKIVLRILNPAGMIMALDELGFNRNNKLRYFNLLEHAWGMILVTGPTGCGKTTTLYSTLRHISNPWINTITVEDPVEYRLEHVNQVQVNTKTGLTFARALRTVLRQDPDVIMVGEIRDRETAEIAARAALTGHLVFSTLHTSDAPRAVTRLLDMDVEPYMLNSSLVGVVSQRLIRLNCRQCLEEDKPTPAALSIFHEAWGENDTPIFYRGQGCTSCNHTGYYGRTAIHEIMPIDETMRSLIQKTHSSQEIRNYAVTSGMKTLIEDGMEQAAQGQTTLQEVISQTFYPF